jgi:hypothetical protein
MITKEIKRGNPENAQRQQEGGLESILTNRVHFFAAIFVWLFIMVAIIGLGCDAHKKGLETVETTGRMSFTTASKGLPSKGQWRHSIAFADLNGDGHLDILSPPPRTADKDAAVPHAWYGDGKGVWERADLLFPKDLKYDYGSIVADDFDKDGLLDVALAMHATGLRAFRGVGEGRFEDFSNGLPGASEFRSRAIIADQFDEGALAEFAAVSEVPFGPDYPRPSGVRVCAWTSEGKWSCRVVGDPETLKGLVADHLTAGDVNGDGYKDIAIGSLNATKPLIVWVNEGKGHFTPFNEGLPKDLIFFYVALADIDRDGRDDLVGAVSGIGRQEMLGIKAFLSRPDGWQEASKGLPEEVFWCVAACDMDHDGAMEILGATNEGGIRVFSLRTDGWQEVLTSGLPKDGLKRIYGIYCRDVNGDGYGDVVVNYADDSTDNRGGIQVFLMEAKGAGGEPRKGERG